ncbi:protein LicA [Striga asiatica]|uniref:Protein LicA n=1 Tax=Striga asiatica TaxID=4170 RepID=A0A5A7P9I2_STRAF|nr:protein LicA [Striga asiatica]
MAKSNFHLCPSFDQPAVKAEKSSPIFVQLRPQNQLIAAEICRNPVVSKHKIDDSHRNPGSEGLYSGKSLMSSDTTVETAALSHSSASFSLFLFELPAVSPEQVAL